jgi:hypothetical protein
MINDSKCASNAEWTFDVWAAAMPDRHRREPSLVLDRLCGVGDLERRS